MSTTGNPPYLWAAPFPSYLMNQALLLQELETLAAQLGVEVRYEELEGEGGLCRYGGRYYVIAGRHLATNGRIRLLIRELRRLPLEGVYLRPSVRELLENPPGPHSTKME
ncbi:MAG: hypothetical protein FJY95_20475 [Candidatus Handelsmanbacteria bacterium]|nr:hypothetical protein [Candidatus Handelsmanbacteria bacterium]